jgi:AbrB family looped-hinge helix DNA binding protein
MRVTTKGQVTIPKDIRDELGIVPGAEVEFVRTGDGVIRLVAVDGELSAEERKKRFLEALDRMAGTIDLGGMTTDEYMEFIRGPREDLNFD